MCKQITPFAIIAIALLVHPLSLSSQNSFSLSLDANGAAGDQAVTSLSTSSDQVVSIQVFGSAIQNANSFGLRFEYDASQVTYQGFDAGSVLPGTPHILPEQGTNPTYVKIGIASLGDQATVSSGLVGTIRFRTTAAFSGTSIRLARVQLGRNRQFETVEPNVRVELQVGSVAPSSDFNGDGTVNVDDFLLFISKYGSSRGDGTYQAKYDLDSNGVIGVSDFLIFVNDFGKQVPSSGSGGSGGSGGGGSDDGAKTFDQTVAQIQTLEAELEQNRKRVEQEIAELRENHPLNAPKDQFESNADYAARQSQLDSILIQSRQELVGRYSLEETQTQIAQLYRKTFPTDNIVATLGTYNADAGYFPITFEITLNGASQRYDGWTLMLNRDDARTLHDNWDKVVAKGYLAIDPGYRQALVWVKLEYTPIWSQGFWWELDVVHYLDYKNRAVDFSPDGKYILTASQDDRMATLWDMINGQVVRQLEHGPYSGDYVYAVAFSSNGQYFATGGEDRSRESWTGKTALWEMNSGRKVRQMEHNAEVMAVAFSPDGKYLAAADQPESWLGKAILWLVNSGQKVQEMVYKADSSTIYALAFSPDGKYLATGNTREESWLVDRASLWDVSSGQVAQQINHAGRVNAVAFSPDGKYLATGGYLKRGDDRGVVTLWKVTDAQIQDVGQSLQQIEHANHINAIAFSPDGKYLAVGEEFSTGEHGAITIYRIPTNITLTTRVTKEKRIYTWKITDLAWSPYGRFFSEGKGVYRVIPRPDLQ